MTAFIPVTLKTAVTVDPRNRNRTVRLPGRGSATSPPHTSPPPTSPPPPAHCTRQMLSIFNSNSVFIHMNSHTRFYFIGAEKTSNNCAEIYNYKTTLNARLDYIKKNRNDSSM